MIGLSDASLMHWVLDVEQSISSDVRVFDLPVEACWMADSEPQRLVLLGMEPQRLFPLRSFGGMIG